MGCLRCFGGPSYGTSLRKFGFATEASHERVTNPDELAATRFPDGSHFHGNRANFHRMGG